MANKQLPTATEDLQNGEWDPEPPVRCFEYPTEGLTVLTTCEEGEWIECEYGETIGIGAGWGDGE